MLFTLLSFCCNTTQAKYFLLLQHSFKPPEKVFVLRRRTTRTKQISKYIVKERSKIKSNRALFGWKNCKCRHLHCILDLKHLISPVSIHYVQIRCFILQYYFLVLFIVLQLWMQCTLVVSQVFISFQNFFENFYVKDVL